MEGMFWQWVGLRDMLAFKVFFFFIIIQDEKSCFLKCKEKSFCVSPFFGGCSSERLICDTISFSF